MLQSLTLHWRQYWFPCVLSSCLEKNHFWWSLLAFCEDSPKHCVVWKCWTGACSARQAATLHWHHLFWIVIVNFICFHVWTVILQQMVCRIRVSPDLWVLCRFVFCPLYKVWQQLSSFLVTVLIWDRVECGSNSAFMNENTQFLLILLCIFAVGCVSSFGTADPFSVYL